MWSSGERRVGVSTLGLILVGKRLVGNKSSTDLNLLISLCHEAGEIVADSLTKISQGLSLEFLGKNTEYMLYQLGLAKSIQPIQDYIRLQGRCKVFIFSWDGSVKLNIAATGGRQK